MRRDAVPKETPVSMRIVPLLALAILIWLVYRIWRNSRHDNTRRRAPGQKTTQQVERMVRCAKCGLHIPQHEALRAGERFYCSPAHRDSDEA